MRVHLAAAACVALCAAAGAWATACGLPAGGLLVGDDDDASEDSAASDDAACTSVDTACLGSVPQGWAPVTVTDAGCGPGFDAATLVVNPRVEDGGCTCGACQVVGAFSCDAQVPIAGGDQCHDPPWGNAVPGQCLQGAAQHVEAFPPLASGQVGCFAPNDAGRGATADPLVLCVPGCSADFCGAPARCLVADGEVPCPPGFSFYAHAGTAADPGCAPCACEAGPPTGACGGTVTVFDNATCADSGAAATYAVATCHQYSTSNDYQSARVDLVPPDASCWPAIATPGAGDASLVGVQTICCQ